MSDPARCYYQAALVALRFIESRKPSQRRFGENAQALWSEFRGDLTDADRMDLMLRDADVQWPGGFGSRTVFESAGVAEDDAFGAHWAGLDAVDAADVLRGTERETAPADAVSALARAAEAWGFELTPFDGPPVDAADRLVIAGPSAVTALMRVFSEGRDLDWVDQVTCIASSPPHRQIAALAGGLLNIQKRARIFSADKAAALKLRAKVVTSPDAEPRDAEAARAVVTGPARP